MQRLGQTLGGGLFRGAGWAAADLSKVDPDAGRRWKAFLATSIHGHSAPVATETFLSYQPNSRPEDPTVLRAALRPYLVLKRRWSLDGSEDLTTLPDAEVHWNTKERSLTKHVLKVIEATVPGDLMLGAVLEDSLSAAYDLLDAYHGLRSWDPLNFRRSAIEPHGQDRFRHPVDAVIDGLRAYGEKALLARPDLPERWWSIGRDLFRRLALHLVALDASRSYDEKISWLLERSALYETTLKHETYRILKVSAEKASKEARDHLLSAAQAGPSLPKDVTEDILDREQHTKYATYNLLVWLTQVAPGWAEAGTALAEAQDANHVFAPRENPDFDKWMTTGTWGGKLPMELDDFIGSLEKDPAGTVDDLLAGDYSERSLNEPEWRDALSLVSQVAESRPDLGEQLWALVDDRPDRGSQADDLRRAIVDGWAESALGAIANTVVARVTTQVASLESARSVGRFLLEQVRKQIESDETPALAAMRLIALDLWRKHGHSFTHSEAADPNSMAPLTSILGQETSPSTGWLRLIDDGGNIVMTGWASAMTSTRLLRSFSAGRRTRSMPQDPLWRATCSSYSLPTRPSRQSTCSRYSVLTRPRRCFGLPTFATLATTTSCSPLVSWTVSSQSGRGSTR